MSLLLEGILFHIPELINRFPVAMKGWIKAGDEDGRPEEAATEFPCSFTEDHSVCLQFYGPAQLKSVEWIGKILKRRAKTRWKAADSFHLTSSIDLREYSTEHSIQRIPTAHSASDTLTIPKGGKGSVAPYEPGA